MNQFGLMVDVTAVHSWYLFLFSDLTSCVCLQGFVEDAADVIVVVEPAHHDSDDADLVVAEQTPTTDAATDRHSPARAEGSINCAYTPSSSSEEEVNVNSQGRKGRKKKQRKNNQVV